MLPTFNVAGDLVLIDKLFWRFRELELGSIIVYQSPRDPDRFVIKRLLGKPGDLIYIDPTVSNEKVRVPEGHIWTQGDNYTHSNDSRHYGPVSMGLIQGQVLCQVWPILKFIDKGLKPI
jgi:signal peptidase I